MPSHESLAPSGELQQKLQSELGFVMDERGEWLISDDFHVINGINYGEDLSGRTRISADGSRFESGYRVEDLQGLLALTKIKNPHASDVDAMRNFWPEDSPVRTTEEDGYLFMGLTIEPTLDGADQNDHDVDVSYIIALSAAQDGRSYDSMLNDEDSWASTLMEQILHPDPEGGASRDLFNRRPRHDEEDEYEVYDSGITAETLKDFPLTAGAPGWIVPMTLSTPELELSKEQTVHLRRRRGKIIDTIDIPFELHDGSEDEDDEPVRYLLSLPVLQDAEINTVADLSKLGLATMAMDTDGRKSKMPFIVNIEVDTNSFSISPIGEEFTVTVRAPLCEDCHKPQWLFRQPTAEENKTLQSRGNYREADIILRSQSSGSTAVYKAELVDRDGAKHEYCIDHIDAAEQRYVAAHPFASRARAFDLGRKVLTELGYADVTLEKEFMDRDWDDPGWHFYPFIKYSRDDRKITRFIVGDELWGIKVSDDGEVENALPSREYVEFRS